VGIRLLIRYSKIYEKVAVMGGNVSRKEFLEAIYHDYFSEHNGFIMVQSHRRLDAKKSARFFPNSESLIKEQYATDQNVFFGVCPRERMKPGVDNIKYISCLWAGLDLAPDGYSGGAGHFGSPAYAAKAVRSFPLPPSIIVESGWGLHLYWLLEKTIMVEDRKRVESLLKKINEYFQCKKEISLDSTLRLPDTINNKVANEPMECNVKYFNPQFAYTLDQLEQMDLKSLGVTASVGARKKSADHGPMQATPQEEMEAGSESVVEVLEEYMSSDEPIYRGSRADSQAVEAVSPETIEMIADKVADRVLGRLAGDVAEEIARRIMEKMAAAGRNRQK
jgi:hypothetical protein